MNDDLISRSALKKKIEEVQYTQEFCIEHQIDYSVSMQMLGMVIDNAPTVLHDNYSMGYQDGVKKVLSERPNGEWIKLFENPFTNGYVCSFCGHKIQVTEQFLPKVTECEVCGADMRGEEAENEH